jgi:hypothetical protein
MLKVTIEAGVALKAITGSHVQHVNVDTTVQTEAIRHPTDSKDCTSGRGSAWSRRPGEAALYQKNRPPNGPASTAWSATGCAVPPVTRSTPCSAPPP